MPIYQYDCSGCGDRVEVLHRSAASIDTASCPQCGGTELKRVMSTFARHRTGAQRLEEIDARDGGGAEAGPEQGDG